ncbi:RAQPRD family integrative conjugative element protein [Saezia sanguinis]|uniref:integrative conjugative element protein, RAQPRD family n=1 Tax=Saezia sanguinis TaxID=1965230 RepID=UPI003056C5A4
MPKLFYCLKLAIAVLFTGLLHVQVHAQPADSNEHAQLALFVRQLNTLERIADESHALSQHQDSRYHFDYQRLHEDIQRIRSGIHDYLRPQRAQPRDPVEISAHYITEHVNNVRGQP